MCSKDTWTPSTSSFQPAGGSGTSSVVPWIAWSRYLSRMYSTSSVSLHMKTAENCPSGAVHLTSSSGRGSSWFQASGAASGLVTVSQSAGSKRLCAISYASVDSKGGGG